MRFKFVLFFIFGFLLFKSLTYSHAYYREIDQEIDEAADTTRKSNPDSVRAARAHASDSLKTARTHALDSMKTARKQKTDSITAVRKHNTDSLATIRKYKDSKHYKDSVAKSRLKKANAIKKSRQEHMDSLKTTRKEIADSIATVRKERTDSIKTIQKHRTDSLAKIKKYRESKRYKDSVTIVRRNHSDSVKAVQKAFRDSVAAVRKHNLDSTKLVRQHYTDSVKTVRTKFLDSVKLVRKHRTDSLAKVKAEKEKLAKANEKKKQDAAKLKIELKIKQKREAWSNKSMLKKKWRPVRRFTQNSFTHYNYYYNANRKMNEALLNMQRTRKENYDSLINLFPYDPNRDSSMMAADMDSIIHKISVGIQIHDPRVKWENDLYLLLGEAYYYKGNYKNAAIAFRYIIASDEEAQKKKMGTGYSRSKSAPSIVEEDKKSKLSFLQHKSVHNDAILWLARTYTSAHQIENAESILSLLESDAKLPESLKGRLAIEKAFIYLNEHNDAEASTQLDIAMDDGNLPSWLRTRASFLNGQLLQGMEQHEDAASSFEKTLTFYPKIEMDFYARKYIAYNKLMTGQEMAAAMSPLKKILSDGKYQNYYDQVYYVLGMLAVKANKNEDAITYLTKSTTTPKGAKNQKALSFAALGDVYYSEAQYTNARNAYDSAAKYAPTKNKDKSLLAAEQRSKGLKEISGPATVIHDQDSLLALAQLSKKEQQSAVRHYLRYLEQKMQDSIQAAENAGVNSVAQADADQNGPGSGGDAASWYFSNTTLMQQGSSDFKRKWGNRPLTDNWRRSSAGSPLAGGSNDEDEGSSGSSANGLQENGLPTEESLLAKIPNTKAQKDLAIKLEQKAYIQLAKAYMKQLEDYNQASRTLDTLDIRIPDHNQKEEELYLRYQIAVKQNKLDKAQQYASEMVAKYPKSEYASAMRPKNTENKNANIINGQPVAAYYEETYALILQHQYADAIARIDAGRKQIDDLRFTKRFAIAEASAYAGMGQFDKADTVISAFIRSYPSDSLTGWATTVKEYIKQVRNGGKPSWYKDVPDKPIAATDKTAPKTDALPAEPVKPLPPPPPAMYAYHADSEHYCIVVLPGLDSRTAALKKSLKSLDSAKYASAGLDILIDLYDNTQCILLVKKFADAAAAKKYIDDLKASPALKDYNPSEVQAYAIWSTNYKKMYADKAANPYAIFYKAYYQ